MEAAKPASRDKYVVSFNSDTSDSEDDEPGAPVVTGVTRKNEVKSTVKLENASDKGGKGFEYQSADNADRSSKHVVTNGIAKDTAGELSLDLLTSGPDCSRSHGRGGASEPEASPRTTFKRTKAIDSDLLIDLSYEDTKMANHPQRETLNSDLEGLSFNYSPKGRAYKLSMDECDDAPKVEDYRSKSQTDKKYTEYDDKSYSRKSGLMNGHDISNLDFDGDDVVAVRNKDKSDILDADLLIYASHGTKSKIDTNSFDYKEAITKTRSFDLDTLGEEKSFRRDKIERQTSMPDKIKDKYTNLDEKFAAICGKYGKDRKKTTANDAQEPPFTPPADKLVNDDIYGAVRIKTGVPERESPISPPSANSPQNKTSRDEDSGFSEDTEIRTPRQKLTFDDLVNWDKSSTDDLIKRILADARDEGKGKFRDTATVSHAQHEPQTGYTARYKMPEPYEKEMGGNRSYESHDSEPSLLERRLASLGKREKPDDDVTALVSYEKPMESRKHYGGYDDEPETLYKRKSRAKYLVDDDDVSSVASSSSNRYVPWNQRQKAAPLYDDDDTYGYKSAVVPYQIESDSYQTGKGSYQSRRGSYQGGSALAIPRRYDDSDSDNESYVSRREVVPVLPDELFLPQRSDDTDDIVRERTFEAKTMVDNQAEVLGRLKKASDSFDSLDLEIRQLRQEMIERQAHRQTLIENIMADIQDEADRIPDVTDSSPYSYNPSKYRSSLARSDTFGGYSLPYVSKYGRRDRDTESCSRLDNDLESDRLGGYALGAVAKSKYGEPGGSRAFRSASVSRFDNIESEKYDKYGLYIPSSANAISKKLGLNSDDYDVKSDYGIEAGDDAETASIRSYPSEKSGGADLADDEGSSTISKPRSRYGASKTTYEPPSRYDFNSTFNSSNRPSRSTLSRSYAVNTGDMNNDRPRIRGSSMPPLESKPFQSRFLSKVREKRDKGDISTPARDKPFKSRFLGRSFDKTDDAT